MKAILFSAVEHAELVDIREPEISHADEVKIRVMATGICSSDIAGLCGKNRKRIPPVIAGHETAGIVVEMGPEVRDLKVGDRVAVEPQVGCGKCDACREGSYNVCSRKKILGSNDWQGAFAEYITVPEQAVIRLPDDMSFEDGALLEPLAVGFHAAEVAGDITGKLAVIIGSGPIGLSCLAAIREKVGSVIVLGTRNKQLESAKALGADFVINVREEDGVQEVNRITKNRGAQVIFMAGGHSDTLNQAISMAAFKAEIIHVTHFRNGSPEFDTAAFIWKELKLLGSYMYTRENYLSAIDSIRKKRFTPGVLITDRAVLDEALPMFEAAQKKSGEHIKMMIRFDK